MLMYITVRQLCAAAAIMCVAGSVAAPAMASSKTPGKVIAGWVEKVSILDNQRVETKAKLDTGAKTSSIHAETVERFKKDGDRWVRFVLVLKGTDDETHRVALEKPVERNIRVKDHDDPSSRRPIVELPVCFDGRMHTVDFSLADRSGFIYSVLIGRRFLNDVAVVDAGRTFLTKASCTSE